MNQFYTRLQTNFIIYAGILSTNFSVFNNPSMIINVLMMSSNSLKMIKIDRNMSELSQIVCKKRNLTLMHLLVVLCELFF
jgi:hypothetical protein